MIIDKEIIKILTKYLNNYSNYKKLILNAEEEILNNNKSIDLNRYIKSKNSIGNNIENRIIEIDTNKEINFYKNIIKSIDQLKHIFRNDKLKMEILNYKYINTNTNKEASITDKMVIQYLEEKGLLKKNNYNYYLKHKERLFYKFEQIARKNNIL